MEEVEEKKQDLSKVNKIAIIVIAWPALLTLLWFISYINELIGWDIPFYFYVIAWIVLYIYIISFVQKIKRWEKFNSMKEKFDKKLSRAGKNRLVLILTIIIALAFWTVFFYFQILINSDDHKSEPLKQIQYENVELALLKVGMPINGDIIKLEDFINKGYVIKKTTVGGILGIVLIGSNNDTINPTADEITYFSDIHELDTLPIQSMIKDIEHTFDIEFIKAPMDSEIDLFTIKNNVEFDCSFSNFHLMFSMKRRYD